MCQIWASSIAFSLNLASILRHVWKIGKKGRQCEKARKYSTQKQSVQWCSLSGTEAFSLSQNTCPFPHCAPQFLWPVAMQHRPWSSYSHQDCNHIQACKYRSIHFKVPFPDPKPCLPWHKVRIRQQYQPLPKQWSSRPNVHTWLCNEGRSRAKLWHDSRVNSLSLSVRLS